MKRTIVRGGLIALLTSVLVACGGGGSDGINGAPGAPGGTTPVTSPGIQAGALSPADWAALQMQGQITAVTLGGPPASHVHADRPERQRHRRPRELLLDRSPATPCRRSRTVTAAIAKLVPGTNGSPSKWVSYNVVTVDAKKTDAIVLGFDDADHGWQRKADVPGQRAIQVRVRHRHHQGEGVRRREHRAPFKADVGDTTYDPSLSTRVVIQIAGAARGTGTNTADGVQTTPAVNLGAPVNLVLELDGAAARHRRDRVVQRLPQRAGVPRQRRPGRHRLLRGLPHQPAQVRRRRRPRSAPTRGCSTTDRRKWCPRGTRSRGSSPTATRCATCRS